MNTEYDLSIRTKNATSAQLALTLLNPITLTRHGNEFNILTTRNAAGSMLKNQPKLGASYAELAHATRRAMNDPDQFDGLNARQADTITVLTAMLEEALDNTMIFEYLEEHAHHTPTQPDETHAQYDGRSELSIKILRFKF